jgi:hypothetical protein
MPPLTYDLTIKVDFSAIRALVAEMIAFGEALEGVDFSPFLEIVQRDKAPQDWYDIWTKDLM